MLAGEAVSPQEEFPALRIAAKSGAEMTPEEQDEFFGTVAT